MDHTYGAAHRRATRRRRFYGKPAYTCRVARFIRTCEFAASLIASDRVTGRHRGCAPRVPTTRRCPSDRRDRRHHESRRHDPPMSHARINPSFVHLHRVSMMILRRQTIHDVRHTNKRKPSGSIQERATVRANTPFFNGENNF